MTDTDSVENNEVQEAVEPTEQEVQPVEQEIEQVEREVKQVPLSSLQKERKKRQEAEERIKRYEETFLAKQKVEEEAVDDETKYNNVTEYDLNKKLEVKTAQDKAEILRAVEEKLWIKSNPEKAQLVNEGLTDFLKTRPNLSSAVGGASNRYEEAWEFMDKLSPKKRASVSKEPKPKQHSPEAVGSVPKIAAMNQAVDVMSMSTPEYLAWRKSMKRRR